MNDQKLKTPQSYSQLPAFLQVNDEIDLKELFVELWKGKLIIIASTALCTVIAVFYALNAQEWWSSKAVVAKPQFSDFSAYHSQVKQFQPVFDLHQEDGTILVSDELDDLIDKKVLFEQFIMAFNASNNKRQFLNTSKDFQAIRDSSDVEAETTLYAEWFKKITATAENKKDKNSPYVLSLQATTKLTSYSMIKEYIATITRQTHQSAIDNLQSVVNGKRDELMLQKRILESQAKNKLKTEIERAQYSLDIAKAASIAQPIQTNTTDHMFAIDLGYKAIEAKIKVLKSISDLSVIEPRLHQISAKLDMLSKLKINSDVEFNTFRFLEDVQQPITRDKPKRTLIAVLGILLGGMLGVAIVLVRFAFRKEDDMDVDSL
ncbi:LPS O-antigen chain length determinant protein WzzB [Vibrio mediterranei]|uniref:LPS O-antigen chain length determinant protein WzzB n=1 Tax=Vibrio mediterranei TaxID=689 RepID=UPI002284148B|nr:Wzz/FepE/Etk N-terminal domain-containing protein [Vibrio mediterranei]MCY9853638.1 Wzz/FepE/Etk N-terminal domain-containing protein [Vibrio mediterranei]